MIPQVKKLIDIQGLGLDYVTAEGERIRIGATTTLRELEENELFRDQPYSVVYEALRCIRTVQVKNVATIGGNVCAGVPNYDLPIALMALDAKVKAVSKNAERIFELANLPLDYFLTTLKPEELVTEVHLPKFRPGTVAKFLKFGRAAVDVAVVNVACRVTRKEGDRCQEVRIIFGGAGRTPIRARRLEKTFEGSKFTEVKEMMKNVKDIEETKFVSTVHASAEYKREVAKVLLRDALIETVQNLAGA